MKKFLLICLFLGIYSISQSLLSQTPQPTVTPDPENDTDEIKISTNLIRVDVVVMDKKNRPVTNLKLSDFEIFENGKKLDISDFSFISSKSTSKLNLSSDDSLGLENNEQGTSLKEKIKVPTTTKPADSNDIRRTLVLVVDNLGLSFRSVGPIKKSLEKFIKEQIREGDLVSIVTTGRASVLPAFTSDKKELLAIVKKIKWNTQSRGGADYYDPIKMTLLEELSEARGRDVEGVREETAFLEDSEQDRKNNLAIGTISSLQYIVRGMKDLPGRKALVLFSEGFSLSNTSFRNASDSAVKQTYETSKPTENQFGSGVSSALGSLIKTANQASVVIYPIDPRGLQVLGMANSDDDIRKVMDRNFKPGSTDDKRTNREDNFRQSQDGLRVLASETGGFAIINQNEFDKGLEQIMDDQSYYLLSYLTEIETIDNPKDVFERVEIRLKDPNLKVRYRSAFYSEDSKKQEYFNPKTAREKVGMALAYPFKANEIKLNLYSITGNNEDGDFVNFLINISATDLKFKRQSGGMRTANIDMLAMTLNANEKPIDQFAKNFTITVNEATYKNILKTGIVYELPVGLQKSGVYHFRVAIHDSESGKVGAAAKFLDTPKFEKKRLWLSNLILKSSLTNEPNTTERKNDKKMFTDTTLRQFDLPLILNFGAVIYNAQTNENNVRDLVVQTRLFQDNKLVLETPFEPVSTKEQKDLNRIQLTGRIKLEKQLSPGNYIFQVIVKDNLAKKKTQIATQLIDFEIMNK